MNKTGIDLLLEVAQKGSGVMIPSLSLSSQARATIMQAYEIPAALSVAAGAWRRLGAVQVHHAERCRDL